MAKQRPECKIKLLWPNGEEVTSLSLSNNPAFIEGCRKLVQEAFVQEETKCINS